MILVFNTEAEANTALDLINTNYGCDYIAENGYQMQIWAIAKKALTEDKWYFKKPKAHLNKTVDEAMAGVIGYTEQEAVSEGWVEIDE